MQHTQSNSKPNKPQPGHRQPTNLDARATLTAYLPLNKTVIGFTASTKIASLSTHTQPSLRPTWSAPTIPLIEWATIPSFTTDYSRHPLRPQGYPIQRKLLTLSKCFTKDQGQPASKPVRGELALRQKEGLTCIFKPTIRVCSKSVRYKKLILDCSKRNKTLTAAIDISQNLVSVLDGIKCAFSFSRFKQLVLLHGPSYHYRTCTCQHETFSCTRQQNVQILPPIVIHFKPQRQPANDKVSEKRWMSYTDNLNNLTRPSDSKHLQHSKLICNLTFRSMYAELSFSPTTHLISSV